MLLITGWLRFKPEDRDDVLAGLANVTMLSRQDPGCIDYWWAESVDDPNTFRFFECWESEEHFEAHQAQPFETDFMRNYVSRITGADAYKYDTENRRSAIG